ncbi:MAG: SDR family NAD(P)-dependent oxidoreductase [Bacteroidales bacterium]
MKVKNKKIVVTGGGSGIGRDLVYGLIDKGAHVVAVDINEKSLKETSEKAGKKKEALTTMVLDVTDKTAVEDFARNGEGKNADIIINNAGIIQPFVKLNKLEYDAIERVMNVNLYGTLYMTKAFLPGLLKRDEAHIVNVSSMGGFLPVPGQTIYGAAKAAVKLLTEGLHSELTDTNVKVTLVFPGAIATNISKNSGLETPKQSDSGKSVMKTMPSDKAAAIIINAIEKDKYRVLVGSDAKFMDRIYRLHPRKAAGFIAKKMKDLLR